MPRWDRFLEIIAVLGWIIIIIAGAALAVMLWKQVLA